MEIVFLGMAIRAADFKSGIEDVLYLILSMLYQFIFHKMNGTIPTAKSAMQTSDHIVDQLPQREPNGFATPK